jgi:multiple sugar transport system substrate-binding protein
MFPGGGLDEEVEQQYIDTFNVKMEEEGKPWRVKANVGPPGVSEYQTKITVDAAGGALSDVVWVRPEQLADFVAAGYLLDLAPYVENWDDWELFYPVIREQLTFDGSVRAISFGTTFTFFYRKDVMEEAGISTEQPKTWDDFYDTCDNIRSETDAIPVGLPAGTAWGGGSYDEGFRHVWLSFEGNIYDETDEKWVISSPNLLKAFEVYEKLAKNEWLTVEELLTPRPWVPIKYEEFPAGKTLIVTGGDWQWELDWGPAGKTPIEGLFEKVDRWKFPSGEGDPFVYVRPHRASGVSSKTKNPEGAFEFLKHKYSPEVQCRTYPTYLPGPSGRSDTAEKCEYYRTAVNGKMVEAEATFGSGRYLRPHPGESKIADGIARASEDVITLEKTAEEAMVDFARAMREALGEEFVKEA